ncbi:hypothetical protein PybrP1_000997 [[Pythium] brassicae (nom. inval.)]|nr:hypothetical protein PybrP1_000997 [[Pythium] brassicae (nom. inval.)]
MLPALMNNMVTSVPWGKNGGRRSSSVGGESDLLALKQRLAHVTRTRTASSQMDLDDAENQLSDDLTETESAVSSSSPSSSGKRQPRALHAASFDPYEVPPSPSQQPALRATVFSFARAGLNNSKMLLNKLPAASRRKPHSRSVDELSESDFAPFAAGTVVSTKFGLGTVLEVRERDGVTAVQLQSRPPMLLYTPGNDDEYYAVPALVGDWVRTPAGEGCVLGFDAGDQMYAIRIGGDAGCEYECRVRQADVQRYVRARRNSLGSAPSSALQKGLSTALKTIVSTSSGLSASTYQFMSNKYYHGQCVITAFGSGSITALDAGNKTVQVQLTWGATAYLNADMIKFYPKALVGMDVSTKFGAGRVEALRPEDAIYTVRLHEAKAGESDIVYVHESDVARLRRLTTAVENVQKQVRGRWMAFANKRFAKPERMSTTRPEEEIHTAGI